MLNNKLLPKPPKKEIVNNQSKKEIAKAPIEEHFPPLFIKVEKYREILRNLEELGSYVENFREVVKDLNKTENELQKRIAMTHQNLEKIAETIFSLNSQINPSKKPNIIGQKTDHLQSDDLLSQADDLEGYLKSMKEAMNKIKNEINL